MKKKNAFTLIELLAVIVILAIIALIATPIILGIIEDTKRDAFARSVELVVSATDLDVVNKITNIGYEYELIDGKIRETIVGSYDSLNKEKCNEIPQWEYLALAGMDKTSFCDNTPQQRLEGLSLTEYSKKDFPWERWLKNYDALEITKTYNELNLAKNTEGMNGRILYDENGNDMYAIHNDTYCVTKLNEREVEVTEYEEGKCNITTEFANILNKVQNEGESISSGDGQLINLGKYGIRFQGNNPNNYVIFNNELWRIMGVVDGNIKIVRSTSLAVMSWDNPGNDCDPLNSPASCMDGDNNWSDATLQIYLNGEYYNGINSIYQQMIQESSWYLRGHNSLAVTKYEMYDLERTTGTILYETPSTNKNIGLMYASDWALGAIEKDNCLATTPLNNYRVCGPTNWLSSEIMEYFITSASNNSILLFQPLFTYNSGPSISSGGVFAQLGVRPVLYLKPEVVLDGGIGTKENPYQLTY